MLVPSLVALATAMSTLTSATPISTSADAAAVVPEIARSVAPLLSHAVDMGKEAIEDSYIVVLKPSVPTTFLASHLSEVTAHHSSSSLADDPEAGITNIYDSERLVGYAGKFDQATLDLIRSLEEVDFVELDSVVTTQETELGAPWGLARLSHRQTLRLSTFTKYEYDAISGEGVDVYVVDTGINIDHVEFEGRASWGKTIPKNDEDKDGNGHGSHCAGTIASRKYGVAKKAHVIAVKVLGSNGSGSMSDVVDGVLYAAESAKKKAKSAAEEFSATGKTSHVGSVASMSLGGGKSPALDRAVNAAVASGLHFAVAAGNDNKDACNYSPAAAEKAITVGASTLGDERAYFSNHGSCVDIFAPGLNILSTWTGGNTTTNVISGTSMATPHIAGLLAYLLSVHGTESFSPTNALSFGSAGVLEKAVSLLPSYIQAFLPGPQSAFAPVPKKPEALTPAELKKALLKLATVDTLSDANGAELPVGSPNLLAFNNYTTKG